MEYREVRGFRDGTVMVEVNGKLSIVGHDINEHLKKKNWPVLVAGHLQEQFPHMKIEFVDDDIPGISILSADGHSNAFCNWQKKEAPEVIYAAALNMVGMAEQGAIQNDPEYFITHYIKTNTYGK